VAPGVSANLSVLLISRRSRWRRERPVPRTIQTFKIAATSSGIVSV
jgi:hypothetical protein